MLRKKILLIKSLWPILIITAVGFLLLRSLLQPDFPETHDGQSHLARLANFHLAAIDRHFPVRWAPNLNYKFGYPVFHFNYYTPYVLALVPIKMGFSFETSFKIVFLLSLISGGVFWHLLLKDRLGRIPALVGGLIYISAPYQLVNILIRGSVGEIVALGLFPFLLWAVQRLVNKPSRFNFIVATLGIAILFLTHNITAVFGMPILALYALVLIWEKKAWKRMLTMGLSFALGIGMTLFFWIPALLEKKFTNMDAIDMSHEYIDHFPAFSQLLHSAWTYGLSVAGPDDGFSFELGPFHWLAITLSIIFFIITYLKHKKIDWLWLFFCLVFVGAVVFMNQATLPIWQVIPMARYIQFPWRLLGFALIGTAFLSAWLTKKLPVIGIALAVGAVIYMAVIVKPYGGFNWDNYFYYEWPFTSSIKGLNMPIWFDLEKNHELQGKIFDLKGVASIKEWGWKTQRHDYEIDTPAATEIWERTAYFPGWEVYIDGQKTEINYQRKDYPGVITFSVPPGKHEIKTVLTENTPARRLGDTLSLVSLTIFIGIMFIGRLPYVKLFNQKRTN